MEVVLTSWICRLGRNIDRLEACNAYETDT